MSFRDGVNLFSKDAVFLLEKDAVFCCAMSKMLIRFELEGKSAFITLITCFSELV